MQLIVINFGNAYIASALLWVRTLVTKAHHMNLSEETINFNEHYHKSTP